MRRFDGCFGKQLPWSVRGILGECGELLKPFPWALITIVDSLADLTTWKVPSVIRDQMEFVGQAIRVPTDLLVEAARADVFSGFYEVWLGRDVPRATPPPGAFLVSPYDVEGDEARPALVEWMRSGICAVGLGDGIGVNIVSVSAPLIRSIEGTIRDLSDGEIAMPRKT